MTAWRVLKASRLHGVSYHALRYGAGVAIHLSNLRPKGSRKWKGLTASGPVSFGKIYSTLNEILRRGGTYKNGACVLHLDLNCADALEFIQTPRLNSMGKALHQHHSRVVG